jgi:hypothetical protein
MPQENRNRFRGSNPSSQFRFAGSSVPSLFVYIVIGLFVFALIAGGVLAAVLLLPKPCTGAGPVCGTDGKTYDSSCLAQSAGVMVKSNGSCIIGCIDSDGGRDIFVAGSASKGGSVIDDGCFGKSDVLEAFCSGNVLTSTTFPCPAGYECSGGACIKASCFDSDGGQVKAVQGSVLFGSTNATDECVSTTKVKEYYCNNGALASADLDCDAGSSCVNGACVVNPCSDSDGGKDTTVAGIVTKGSDRFTDKCDGASVLEYYCDNGDVKSQDITCPSGSSCDQGRCLEVVCTDSDSGMDQFTKGTTSFGQTTYQDSCYSNLSVLEYYCSSNKSIGTTTISCGSGNECQDGRCKAATCVSAKRNLDTTDEEMLVQDFGSSDEFTLEKDGIVRINNGYILELYSIVGNMSYFRLYNGISAYRDNDYLCSMPLVIGNSTTTMCSKRINKLKVTDVASDESASTLQISGYYVTEYFSEDGQITDWTDSPACQEDVIIYNSFVAEFFPSIDTSSTYFNLAGESFRFLDGNATLRQVTSSSIRFLADGTTYDLSDGEAFTYKGQRYVTSLTFISQGLTKMEIQKD